MAVISLTTSQRQELQHLARLGRDARVVRRAQGLLWLDQGEHPIAVAQRLAVTRESVYAWARRLRIAGANPLSQRLTDQPRSGRPTGKRRR
jgi:transposase